MPNTRPGCEYCFKVLDPRDKQSSLRTFVKCSRCGSVYHTTCWQLSGVCLRCNSDLAKAVKIAPPSRLKIVTKTKPIPIKPSTTVTEDGTKLNQVSLLEFLRQSIHYFAQVVRSVVVATFLLAIAVFIGVFAYRIAQLNPINAETVMDAIFKKSIPSIYVFAGALISGIIFASIFYSRSRSNASKNNERPWVITYFLAGVIIIFGLDIVFLKFSTQDLLSLNINLRPYNEILYAQGITALIVILLTPLHRKLASLTVSPIVSFPPFLIGMYGWIRFLFVSLLLNLSVMYLSTLGLPHSLNVPKLANISLGFMDITLTVPMLGAFVAGVAVASIAYWPPKFRQLKGRFGTLRLLLVMLSLITIGFMYRLPVNTEWYLNTIMIACIAMFIATPVQRSLS